MECLVRIEDKIVRLNKVEYLLLLEAGHDLIRILRHETNLFDEENMIKNVLLIEYIEDIKCLFDKFKGGK